MSGNSSPSNRSRTSCTRSRRSSDSSGSSGSTATLPSYCAKIAEIRPTTDAEAAANNGATLFIKRYDAGEEHISSVWESSSYSQNLGESLLEKERPADYWKAYNTIATFILSGRIRLSGGRDCFKKLAAPQPGVKTLKADRGIFFRPDSDISTFGMIYPRAPNDKLTKVHLSSPTYDNRGRTMNAIVLERRIYYLIAGDDSDPDEFVSHIPKCELIISHRGRLREAGFEVPGEIDIRDLWLLDSAGTWRAMRPFQVRKTCSGCIQSYANREWPTIDVCEGRGHCDNATSDGVGSKVQKSGCRPAWAEAECATTLVHKYTGGRMCLNVKHIRNVAKVLDANFTVRDWDHLSEMTGYSHGVLALLFCSVPSLGERLDRKGASFVPWARDSGISLGDYLRIDMSALKGLYVVIDGAVIDKHTGLKVKFEEDGMGVIHVEQGSQDFSESLPEGVSGYVRLG